jgi:hypothetical protein
MCIKKRNNNKQDNVLVVMALLHALMWLVALYIVLFLEKP